MSREVVIADLLYPCFNTVKLDGVTPDHRPYTPGENLPGERKVQYYWNAEKHKNEETPAFYVDPSGRLVLAKQEQFYDAIFRYPEVFYGGAAGGGKSDCLMRSHLLKHLSWNARGIKGEITAMFCETKEELKRRHLAKMWERIPRWMVAHWDAENMILTFKKKYGGGKIMFLYIGRKKDIERILSYEFAYITIDELTRNQKTIYDFITSRLRSTRVPAAEWCVASASNPGSVGHKWVFRRFVNPRTREKDCYFIQALSTDNILLPVEYYDKILGKLPDKIRRAYRDGNWKIFEGQFFDMLDETVHIVPRMRIPEEIPKYLGIDHGLSHPTGATWVAHYPPSAEFPRGRLIVYRYYEEKHKSTIEHKKRIWQRMKSDRNIMSPATLSHDAFNNRGGAMTVANEYETPTESGMAGETLPAIPVTESGRDRQGRWGMLMTLLDFESHLEVDDKGDMHRVIDRMPELYFMDSPDVRMLFDELAGLVHADGKPEDAQKLSGNMYEVGDGDEGPDSLGYALQNIEVDSYELQRDEEEEIELEPYDPFKHNRHTKQERSWGYSSF